MHQEHRISIRQSCKAVGLPRSTYSYQPRAKEDTQVIDALLELVDRHPSIGFWSCYWRIRNQVLGVEPQTDLPGLHDVRTQYPSKS